MVNLITDPGPLSLMDLVSTQTNICNYTHLFSISNNMEYLAIYILASLNPTLDCRGHVQITDKDQMSGLSEIVCWLASNVSPPCHIQLVSTVSYNLSSPCPTSYLHHMSPPRPPTCLHHVLQLVSTTSSNLSPPRPPCCLNAVLQLKMSPACPTIYLQRILQFISTTLRPLQYNLSPPRPPTCLHHVLQLVSTTSSNLSPPRPPTCLHCVLNLSQPHISSDLSPLYPPTCLHHVLQLV